MSSLIVEVCKVDKVEKHPNADRLQVVHVKGWQVVTAVASVKPGDLVVYIPPDSILSQELAEKWGVAPHLKALAKDVYGNRPPGGRVGVAKLRGIHSFGFITPSENPEWTPGTDVAAHYGITKWEPPLECNDGDAASPVPAFHTYTDIENIRNFPNILQEGEEVIFTEKLHGTNCRVGLIRAANEKGEMAFQFMCGSHGVRRKEVDQHGKPSLYWMPLTEKMKSMLWSIGMGERNIIIFGEIYGSGVQDMPYGMINGEKKFRAFDMALDGKYIDFDQKMKVFEGCKIDTVPVLYRGPFSAKLLDEYTTGPTTVCDPATAGKFGGREGIVITPVKERWCEETGRVILKSISPDYQMRRGDTTENH